MDQRSKTKNAEHTIDFPGDGECSQRPLQQSPLLRHHNNNAQESSFRTENQTPREHVSYSYLTTVVQGAGGGQ